MYNIDGLKQIKFYSDNLNKNYKNNLNIINNHFTKCNNLIKKKIIIDIHKKDKKDIVENTLKTILNVNKDLKKNQMKGGSNNKNIKITGNIHNLNTIQKNMINNIMLDGKISGGGIDKSSIFKNITKNFINQYLNNPTNQINTKNHQTRIYIITIVVISIFIILFTSIICYCFFM
tara:strand:+ start:2345 stop:2869 length:525 start_codon:yes stop_codon:yes gene_type:complete